MQRRGKGGIVIHQLLRLGGKRGLELVQFAENLRELDDKLRGRELLSLLIGLHFGVQIRRDVNFF